MNKYANMIQYAALGVADSHLIGTPRAALTIRPGGSCLPYSPFPGAARSKNEVITITSINSCNSTRRVLLLAYGHQGAARLQTRRIRIAQLRVGAGALIARSSGGGGRPWEIAGAERPVSVWNTYTFAANENAGRSTRAGDIPPCVMVDPAARSLFLLRANTDLWSSAIRYMSIRLCGFLGPGRTLGIAIGYLRPGQCRLIGATSFRAAVAEPAGNKTCSD